MEWYQAVIVFAVAFAVAYCMVPVSKKIAFRIGAIDYPGYRRMNREPIPRCGGIALYVGLIAACFTMFLGVRFFDWDLHDLYIFERRELHRIVHRRDDNVSPWVWWTTSRSCRPA